MSDLEPLEPGDPLKMRHSYVQLGLEPGATMHEIETAYWQFARELRGQPAMAPYNQAYEALVNSVKPPANDAPPAPVEPQEAAQKPDTPAARPPSKFGWPAT